MHCSVVRTHYLGRKRPDNDPAPAVVGTVPMYSINREDLRRHVTAVTMDGLAKFGATEKGSIPDLLEPELLTFSSDRGDDGLRPRRNRRPALLPRVRVCSGWRHERPTAMP